MMNSEKSYQLYYFSTCPYCIKTRIQLSRMGVSIPLKNINSDPANKKALIEGGGKEQVPCLCIEHIDGKANNKVEWLYESEAIVKYFKELNRLALR